MESLAAIVSLDEGPVRSAELAPPPGGDPLGDAWTGAGAVLATSTGVSVSEDDPECAAALIGRVDAWGPCVSGSGRAGPEAAGALLEAYRAHGPIGLAGTAGAWALVIWDGRRRRLLLARDPTGSRLLYWRRDGRRVAVGSTTEQLVSQPGPDDLDEDVVLWSMYGGRSPGPQRTFFRGVHRVPSGHAVLLEPDRVAREPVWRWPEEPPDRAPAGTEDAEELRALLLEATRHSLPAGDRIEVLLSGGVDSSAVAGLAAVVGRERGDPVRAWTSSFEHTPGADERRFSDSVVALHRLEQATVPGDGGWTFSDLERFLPWFHEPTADAFEPTHDALLQRALDEGVSALLWGHGGDSILSGSPRYLAGWALRGRLRAVDAQLRARAEVLGSSYWRRVAGEVVAPLLPEPVRRRLEPTAGPGAETWRPEAVARCLGPDRSAGHSGPDGWWYDLREHLLVSSQSPFSGHLDRQVRRWGLRFVAPILDVRVVEFTLRLPPDAHYWDGRAKALLRRALADLLPPVVRDRADKASMVALVHRGLRERRAGFVRALAEDSELAARGWVLEAPWREAVAAYLGGDEARWHPLWPSLTVELWLRRAAGRIPEWD
jgi:asparagine synthase (glutamine-hydrolysing)